MLWSLLIFPSSPVPALDISAFLGGIMIVQRMMRSGLRYGDFYKVVDLFGGMRWKRVLDPAIRESGELDAN